MQPLNCRNWMMLMVWFGKCVGHQPATSQPSPASHHQPPPATTNNAHSLLSCLLSVGESRNPLIPERSLTCCLSSDFDSRSSECAGSRKGNIKLRRCKIHWNLHSPPSASLSGPPAAHWTRPPFVPVWRKFSSSSLGGSAPSESPDRSPPCSAVEI